MAFNDSRWTVGQVTADTLTANSVTSGQLVINGTISGSSTYGGYVTLTPERCLGHVGGAWREEPDGVFSVYCQVCGELMTVIPPDELAWASSLKDLLARVLVGEIDDDLRALVKTREEQLDLATKQMDLLKLLLS